MCLTDAGVGKGLVGVFTRPASGVVDFASSSFDGIRRYSHEAYCGHYTGQPLLEPAPPVKNRGISLSKVLLPHAFAGSI